MNDKIIKPIVTKLGFQPREAINTLRGNIHMAGYNVKVIALTSSGTHEGKSTVSFRLARGMAGIRKRTLFLDCDIRNSRIKERYHIVEKTVGLSEYLCGQVGLEEMIYHTDDPCLDMIFSGKVAPNPSELLSGERFAELIARLKELYDYVIVDTPPTNVVIDSTLVARCCDTTVIVVESGVTNRHDALRMKMQLENAGISIMGAVISKIPKPKRKYGYGKYGYGKYGYGKYGYGKYRYGNPEESYGNEEPERAENGDKEA